MQKQYYRQLVSFNVHLKKLSLQGLCFENCKLELTWLHPFTSLALEVRMQELSAKSPRCRRNEGAHLYCPCTGWYISYAHCTLRGILALGVLLH